MKTFVYIGIIGASALLLASCKGKSKPMETPVPSISVSTPIVRDITLTKEYPGYLSSQLKVDLVARVNGYLRTSYLKAGSRVKKGDLIFVIEPDTYQDNVTQAEASVKTSKAQLEYAFTIKSRSGVSFTFSTPQTRMPSGTSVNTVLMDI